MKQCETCVFRYHKTELLSCRLSHLRDAWDTLRVPFLRKPKKYVCPLYGSAAFVQFRTHPDCRCSIIIPDNKKEENDNDRT